jgi:thiol-disulfide isomerase/thioredoxin
MALVGFIVYVVVAGHPAATPSGAGVFKDPAPASLKAGSAAPAFDLPPIRAGAPSVERTLAHREPVILNFFASWCPNCEAELSSFATVAREEAGHVAVIGIDTDDHGTAAALRLLRNARAAYPVGVDSAGKVATHYLISALPTTYFITANGTIAGVAFGSQHLVGLLHWAAKLESEGAH